MTSTEVLTEVKKDLKRLQKAGHAWHKIGLTLFNCDGSYAAHVYHDDWVPSKKAMGYYRTWKALDRGKHNEASPELCEAVWNYLSPDARFPNTSREMADYFLVPSRKIRKACSMLCLAGHFINSGQDGYNKDDTNFARRAITLAHLISREREIRKRRIALSKIRLIDQRTNAMMIAEGVGQLELF